MTGKAPRILVLGIGNPLVGDEGVGVRVAAELMTRWRFPEHVDVVDAGTMGYGMLDLLGQAAHVILVDAVDGTELPAGTVMRLTPEELAPSQVLHSLHDVRLVDVLVAAELTGRTPHIEVVGVQIEQMLPGVTELTGPVESAVAEAVDAVLALLSELEVVPTPCHTAPPEADVIRAIRTRERMPRPGEKTGD